MPDQMRARSVECGTEATQIGVSKVGFDRDAIVGLMPAAIAAVRRAAEEDIVRFGTTGRAAA